MLEAELRRYDNRKRKAVLFALLLSLMSTGCVAQNVPPAKEMSEQVIEERTVAPAPLLQWEDPESENLAGMLQRECGGVMVRLTAGQHIGSGVLYSAEDGILTIVTAAHVLREPEAAVTVTFVDGWETESSDYSIWEQQDLAAVRVPLEKIPEEGLGRYLLVNVDKEACDRLKGGDGCIVMGSRTGVAEDAYEGVVLDTWIYMEDYGQHMMWVRAYGQPGMSGGGLFDRQGHFLGILSGINEEGEWAVVPLAVLTTRD